MGKKKKKKNKHAEIYNNNDYERINYDGDIRKLMKSMAKSIKCYLDSMDGVIYEGVRDKEFKKNKKIVEKLIKKLKKGDTSVFDIDTLNEVLAQDHQLVIGLDVE